MPNLKNPKYIFVVGGVMSGVGKGVASASIGKILQARGFEVTALKIDPYVNVDAGTMNPTEHGEVFVLDDGTECDQDMGNYERFLNRDFSGANYMTTGSVYQSVITRERNLEYGGKCVEVVPHIPLEVIDRIEKARRKEKAEIVMVEIGGTVGEYQNILFLEAVRMLKIKHPHDVLLILVSYLPVPSEDASEPKTKPTQYAVRTLNSAGLQPDVILARARVPIDKKRKEKIAVNCNLREEDIISAPDVSNLYEIPLNFEKDKLGHVILDKLGLGARKNNLGEWRRFVSKVKNAKGRVRIGIVGKYFGSGKFILADSYISVIEAVKHAAAALGRSPEIVWLEAERLEKGKRELKKLEEFDGIIVPGGFGSRGVKGKLAVIRYCRERKIPYFGLCYGMQLAVVEFARNVVGLRDADTTEINRKTKHPVIDIMPEQKKLMAEKNYGGTMRLGAYPAVLKKGTIAFSAYGGSRGQLSKVKGQMSVRERHRHRYEVNPVFITRLEKKGIVFSGQSPDRRLMEVMELPQSKHPFFLGTQFHPELKSRPLAPHPLFVEFIKAASKKKK
ncbi:MAG: CTP synthase [Candidatus Liptonbacteria bacterium RIFCSPLOWO2_01_FULL_52_25]|uniref:CTP synthase n=1 Tax=Candidatus Liptonbacteria bacterium RIFCSPLOWO2_01_FULL_52_25 TaxID=1798650 RepID=A0A1G2CF21_9BACT|nr:MAG: CTP synthase [Candidatus Liptonbacteria bacterium RIFCSPLOWO2_01_FULL_52_25]